jgi:hypothetical protein
MLSVQSVIYTYIYVQSVYLKQKIDSGQHHKITNSQAKENKTIRNQITAKNIPNTNQKNKEKGTNK